MPTTNPAPCELTLSRMIDVTERACARCGQPFPVAVTIRGETHWLEGGEARMYCGRSCNQAAWRARVRSGRAKRARR